jgi:hypothetical protein
MDGSNHVERVVGEPIPIEFPQSLYDTEICVAVPLPFFLTRNLRSLVDEASTLPTVKSNPAPGETKGTYILNIEKLSTRFGKELTLTCSQWSEAAANMWSFQISRDKLGSEGDHATWFEKHFNFFNMLNKRDELYDAWKVMELEFRQDHRSCHLKFSATDYDKALGLTEESHKLRKEFHEFVNSSQTVVARSRPSYRGSAPLSLKGLSHEALPFCNPLLIPFRQAAASLPPPPSASSVHKGAIPFSSTSNLPLLLNSSTERSLGQNIAPVSVLSRPTTKRSALTGTFEALTPPPNVSLSTRTTAFTSAPSVAAKATMLFPGLVTPKLSDDFVTAARPLPLSYTDFSPSIIPRLPLSSSSPHHCSIFERIPHPYSSDAFETLLLKHNLLSAYPLLPRNLTLGFPLGYMPPL